MATVIGTWQLTIQTPIGKQTPTLQLSIEEGRLHGVVHNKKDGETIAVTDLVQDGDHLTWSLSVRKPMRLNLNFDVTVAGDELTGRAKAGTLPASKVSGHRLGPS